MLIEKMIRFVEKETILLLKQFFKSPTTNKVIFCFSQRHLYSFVYKYFENSHYNTTENYGTITGPSLSP